MANFSVSNGTLPNWLTNYLAGQQSSQQAMMFPKEMIAKELANRQSELMNQLTGVKARYAEPEAQEELQKAKLFNQYYGPNIQSEIGLRGAQAGHLGELVKSSQFERGNPLLKAEATKKFGAMLADPRLRPFAEQAIQDMTQSQQGSPELQQMKMPEGATNYGINNKDLIQPGIQNGMQKPPMAPQIPGSQITKHPMQQYVENALQEAMGGATSGTDFYKLPKPTQRALIEKIMALGYNQQQAIQLAQSGADLDQLAQAHGYESAQAAPELPTTVQRNRIINANMAQAGVKEADKYIEKGIGHYIGGVSIGDVPIGYYKDAFTGKKDAKTIDKMSDYLASTVLAQDQALLRGRQAGAPLSQGLLKHTLDTALTNKKASFPATSPEVFKEASRKIGAALDAIKKAENKAALQPIIPPRNLREELPHEDKAHITDEELMQRAMGGR